MLFNYVNIFMNVDCVAVIWNLFNLKFEVPPLPRKPKNLALSGLHLLFHPILHIIYLMT